nr:MAG TPA: Tail tape measure [Caudoviricetes sp.]
MGVINETLLLTDQFSSSFNTFIDLGNRAVATTTALDKSLTHALGKSAGATIGAIRGLGDQAAQTNQLLEQIVKNQQRHKEETEKTDNAAKKLLGTIKKIAAASGALALVKSFLGFSDAQAQVNARMNLINDGQQTTAELNELIYQSALRAKSSYFDTADAVSKMGLNAKNAFSSNQELIAFTEQVNKQFKIGGASAQDQSNAMVQLTQAMAAGVLRGQDLNSILAAAPGIARTIEESMGWASGSIKKYAEDGKVTAQVVKNALLDMADQTNAKFESIPMTLSDAMTMGKNIVLHGVQDMAAQWNDFLNTDRGQEIIGEGIQLFSMLASAGVDALSAIGRGALWVHDNMDFIIPILLAIAGGIAVMKAASIAEAAATIAGNLDKAASWALANWYIILGVALLASALIAAQQYGVGMQEVGGVVGGVFGFIYAVGYNVFASLWNIIATFAEFFANVFNDPVAAIAHLFSGLLDTILGMVQTAASAIDALLGSNISGAINGFRNDLSSWVDSTFGENAVQIKRMANLDVGTTMKQWGSYGASLGSKLDNLNLNVSDLAGSFGDLDLGDGAGGLGDIGNVGKVGSVGKIDNDVKLSDEDLKLYRNLAERRYMNQIELKTLAPHIEVSIPENEAKNLTAQDIADKLRALLIEQSAAGTAVSHG